MLVTWKHTIHVGYPPYYAELVPRAIDLKATPLKLQLTMRAQVDHNDVEGLTLEVIELDWGTGRRQVSPDNEVSYTDEMAIQDYMDGPVAYHDAYIAGCGHENLL